MNRLVMLDALPGGQVIVNPRQITFIQAKEENGCRIQLATGVNIDVPHRMIDLLDELNGTGDMSMPC